MKGEYVLAKMIGVTFRRRLWLQSYMGIFLLIMYLEEMTMTDVQRQLS